MPPEANTSRRLPSRTLHAKRHGSNFWNNSSLKYELSPLNKMKNFKNSILILTALAAASTAPAGFAQSNQPSPSSAKSSRPSDTDATSRSTVVNACSAAVGELVESRALTAALEKENTALKERLETELRITAVLAKANDARESETAALRIALAAKDETIAAKDAVIENRRQMIETLKKKSSSPFKRIADVLVGAAIFAIIK